MIPAGLAAGGIVGLLRSQYERDHFVLEETVLVSEKIKTERTLVFLSDLHDKEFGPANSRLLQAIASSKPDGILIGGDTMVAKKGNGSLNATENLLRGLIKIAPVYYGNGNHEQRLQRDAGDYQGVYQKFRELMKRYQVTYLQNQSVTVGEELVISGLDISREYYQDFRPAPMQSSYVEGKLGPAAEDRYQILLAHSPLFFEAYAGWGADLTLSGHFHGGTIRLPLLGGLMTPQFQFFLPWCAGNFEQNGHHMIVSRGLGTHSVNIRFGNKPQVVVIKLLPNP